MENKLFLLQEPGAPTGGGTKIVLNRQSDLILTDAQIVAPVGIVEADIDGLIPHLTSVENDLAVEKGRIDAILDGSDVNLDQFVEVVNFVQAIDLENDASLLGAVTSIETKHDAEVSAEESSRIAADDSVEQKMGEYVDSSMKQESNERATADTSLEQELSAEVSDRIDWNENFAYMIDEVRASIDASLEEGIDADASLEESINGVGLKSSDGDTSLEELIGSEMKQEIAAREANDEKLTDSINVEKGRIDAILDGSTVDLDQFSEVVAFVQTIDLENDASLLGAVTSIETKHDAEVSAEISSRESADDSVEQKMGEYVDSSMKKEQADRSEADNSLEELIASEIKTEIEAREKLDEQLNQEVARARNEDEKHDVEIDELEQKIDEEVARARNEDEKHDEEINAINVSISAEASTRELIDEAIKAGVNAALVEIKGMIINTAQQSAFRLLLASEGDGVETTFNATMFGNGAVYLNGLLQREDEGYSYGSTTIGSKGQISVDIIFNEAPGLGSQITIYGQEGSVGSPNWYGDLTPLV